MKYAALQRYLQLRHQFVLDLSIYPNMLIGVSLSKFHIDRTAFPMTHLSIYLSHFIL